MSIPIPKILPAFTLDSALTLKLAIDGVGAFDVTVTVTIPAGTYFMRWDAQSDDFLRVLHLACYTALDACAVVAYNGADNDGKPMFGIDANHKVTITIGGGLDMRFDWTLNDGATVAGILGFDATANLEVTAGETETANWQHAYGWYASAEGQYTGGVVEDTETAHVAQARAIGGEVVTQYLASIYDNHLSLRWLERLDTFSRGVGYTTAPVDPYERNRGIECLWRAIRDGSRFCVYLDSILDTTKAEEIGAYDFTGSLTVLTDAAKGWGVDPQEHVGKLLFIDEWGDVASGSAPQRFYVSSNTATTLTAPNSLNNTPLSGLGDSTYHIFDQRYATYVLDLAKMRTFAPNEIPDIDKYEIDLPLLRYVP